MTDNTDTRRQLERLRKEIDIALAAVTDNNPGIALTLGRCTFDSSGGFTFKLTGAVAGGQSREASDYEHLVRVEALDSHTWATGANGKAEQRVEPGKALPPLGTVMTIGGQKIKILGARLRAQYNVIVEKQDGKKTCYKAADVARIWAKESGHAKP
jgi:hypothetical protein